MLKSIFINNKFHVLVYNSRVSFTGLGEVRDQEELVQATIQRLGGKVEHLVLLVGSWHYLHSGFSCNASSRVTPMGP